MSSLRLHYFVATTAVEGPGLRACLWVQGCSIRCRGCFNSHMWSPSGGQEIEADVMARQISEIEGIEGVTFLGGEPFDQAGPLAELGASVRSLGRSVMTFSGRTLEELACPDRPDWQALLAVTDLLVDGPYDWRRPDTVRPWVGSTNQRFHFLTSRYADLAPRLATIPDSVEVRLHPDGSVWVNGMASGATLRGLRRAVIRRQSHYCAQDRNLGPSS